MPDRTTKDPDALLDYAWDWSPWLGDGETVTSQTLEVTGPDDSLTVMDSPAVSQAGGVVTAWLSGGTAQKRYRVTCHIQTSAGRADDRTMIVYVADR